MIRKRPLVFGILLAGALAALGFAGVVSAHDDDRPSAGQIAFAQEVSDLMLNELVAALFTTRTNGSARSSSGSRFERRRITDSAVPISQAAEVTRGTRGPAIPDVGPPG